MVYPFKMMFYYFQMHLKFFATSGLKYMSLIHLNSPHLARVLEIKLEFFTDIDMLLTVEKVLEEEYVMKYIDMQKQTINT